MGGRRRLWEEENDYEKMKDYGKNRIIGKKDEDYGRLERRNKKLMEVGEVKVARLERTKGRKNN